MSDSTTTIDPRTAPHRRSEQEAPGKLYGLMAEFTSPGDLLEAAERVRDEGYRWWDCHTPFPVHGLDKAMGIRPTILPFFTLGGGLTGALVGLILQLFTNSWSFTIWLVVWVRGYEYLVSGKPMASIPAFIPVTFEMTILLASIGTFTALLLMNGLPQLYHPLFKSERFARATDDRFFVVIEARDPNFSRERTEAFLDSLNPESIEAVEA